VLTSITRPDGSLSFVLFDGGVAYQQPVNVDLNVVRISSTPGGGQVVLPPPRVTLPQTSEPTAVSFAEARSWIVANRAPTPEPDVVSMTMALSADEEEEVGPTLMRMLALPGAAEQPAATTPQGVSTSQVLPQFELLGADQGDSFDSTLSLDTEPGLDSGGVASSGGQSAIGAAPAEENVTLAFAVESGESAENLEMAYLLGDPASQPLGAGAAVNDELYFDYWVDRLVV
jgi:hypothetical protein